MDEGKFEGWPNATIEFYEGLEQDNSKRYWSAHKDVYERQVKAPMESLLLQLAPEFGDARLFRPYRDVRFSRDKSPYKTSIAASLGAYYVALSASGLIAGAGYYQLSGDALERYRVAVAEARSGAQLERIVGELRTSGIDVRSFAELRSAPRGYPKDHPRIELLRYKGVVAMRSWPVAPWLSTAAAAARIEEVFRASKPLVEWLTANVGPAQERQDAS